MQKKSKKTDAFCRLLRFRWAIECLLDPSLKLGVPDVCEVATSYYLIERRLLDRMGNFVYFPTRPSSHSHACTNLNISRRFSFSFFFLHLILY